MKQSELIDWAIKGLIYEKLQEHDPERKSELDNKISELCVLLLLAKQEENRI